jgi:hypothetical protein
VLNILLLIGLFMWLLVLLPNKTLHEQLLKEEQLARHLEIKTTLAQSNERLERELQRMIASRHRTVLILLHRPDIRLKIFPRQPNY